jgi:SAM-dependent methyltransferase
MICNVCGHEITDGAGGSTTKDGFELIRCPQCGLLFRRLLPRRDELDSLYSEEYFRDRDGATGGYADYLGDERLHRSLAASRLARLEGLTSGRKLLDVGAAAGFFVAEATERGWEATGIDVSRPMVEHAAKRGLHVVLGDLHEMRAELFDVVTMWDYIEHSIDPARDIGRCAELLRPGGLVALSTGDVESVVARLSGRHWHLLTPRHHNYFFGRTTIRRLLEAHDFTVLETSHPGARYSLGHIAYKLVGTRSRRLAARTALRVDRSPVGGLAFPVNLFDIVTVFARKHVA